MNLSNAMVSSENQRTRVCVISCFNVNEELTDVLNTLNNEFQRLGVTLVVVTQSRNPKLAAACITVPYSLYDFGSFEGQKPQKNKVSDLHVEKDIIEREQILHGLSDTKRDVLWSGFFNATETYERITRQLSPSLWLIWGSTFPHSLVQKRVCEANNIPVLIFERGLLPQTVMVEESGHGAQSLLCTDSKRWEQWKRTYSVEQYRQAKSYYLERKPQKYTQRAYEHYEILKEKYSLHGKKRILFLGQHDGWSGLLPRESSTSKELSPYFASTKEALSFLLESVRDIPEATVLFKPHPYDRGEYALDQYHQLKIVKDENLYSLLEISDVVVALSTTAQFEALWYEVPLMLLANSQLSGKDAAYEYHGESTLVPLLTSALTREGFEEKNKNARIFLSGILTDFLYGVYSFVPTTKHIAHLAIDLMGKMKKERYTGDIADSFEAMKKEIRYIKVGSVPQKKEEEVQLIAFYLPQFHPIPENDQWWGKGFTEWTNVTRAKPLYPGHYQPHLPADLGFYDLRNPETREAQADLARAYGINGFCYWHYWFNGKMLLERPFQEVLESGKPEFPFCLAWANEHWSRRWHGLEQDVLQEQTYGGDEDDEKHIKWLLRAFQDPRYIKILDKPIFLIYNPSHLPTPERTIEHWRKYAKAHGFPDLYIVAIKSHDGTWKKDWRDVGFDAELLFQPQWGVLKQLGNERKNTSILPGFIGPEDIDPIVVPYEEAWKNFAAISAENVEAYATVVPQWDNSARRKYQPVILDRSLPEEYEKWLAFEIDRARVKHRSMVFINAWNEWAEGNHLEPDQKFGHAYLHATKKARIATNDTIAESICDVVIALLQAGRPERANALLKSVQERFGAEIIQKVLPAKLEQINILSKNKEAVQLYRSGELQKACALLQTLLHERKHPITIQNLACVYFEQKQYARACELVRSPELRNHRSLHLKVFEAECEELLGNTQKALQLYLELLDEGTEVFRWKQRIQRLIAPHRDKEEPTPQNSVTSIIVVTHNNLRYTKECLLSVIEHTAVPYELLIVDNGSSDETQQWLTEFCRHHTQCRYIFNTSNLGFPKAVNQGLRIARGENVVLLNNDVLVTDGWLEGLLHVAQNNENVGLVGPMTNEISGAQKDRTAWYVTLDHMKHHASAARELYRDVVYEAVRVRFFCVLITKKALELCGGLDERFTPGNCEDDDYCLRVQRAGLRIYIAREVFVHHYGSKSFSQQGQEWFQNILEQNIKRFYAKWGVAPTDVGTNNPNEKQYPIKYPVSRNPYEEAIERALLHIQTNEMMEATHCLEEALRLMDSSECYSPEIMNKEDLCDLAGKVYLSLENLERAKELFEIELHLNPTSSRACVGLGRTFYAAALYDASKTMYEYAVVYDENNSKVKEELACVNEVLGFARDHNSLLLSSVPKQEDTHA